MALVRWLEPVEQVERDAVGTIKCRLLGESAKGRVLEHWRLWQRRRRAAMKVHRNCCGLDVHKETIAACLIREDASGDTSKEKRLFGTMTKQLRELAQWLVEAKVSAFAMEATGIYWVPVWNVLEGAGLQLVLINLRSTTERFAVRRLI